MKNESLFNIIVINILLMCLWHYSMFLACVSIKITYFKPDRTLFRPREWEQNGRWYNQHLKINQWKDIMPQYVGKGGFSKKHLTSVSLEYVDQFIMETCRGEWDHWMCSLYFIFSIIINQFWFGILFGLLAIMINMPFIVIQRYNRFRLLTLKKRMLREKSRMGANANPVMA